MKAAVFRGPGSFEVRTVPDPVCGLLDVVLKVLACGVCGSDLHTYRTGEYVEPGQIMGHEFVGVVVEVGEEVDGVSPEDRLVGFSADFCGKCHWCRNKQYQYCPQMFRTGTGYGRPGAYAEMVKLEKARAGVNCFHVTQEMPDAVAATAEPVGVAALTVEQADPPGRHAMVLGAGLIGNAIVQILKRIGDHQVVVSEPSSLRREAALSNGADAAIDPLEEDPVAWVRELWGDGPYHFGTGGMADLVVECAGAENTLAQALELVRSTGTVALVALPDGPVSIEATRLVHKGPRLIGVLGSDIGRAVELLAEGVVRVDDLVTHEYPLDDISEAFTVQQDAATSVKVLVRP